MTSPTQVLEEDEPYKGYRGSARECLERFNVQVWSDVCIQSHRGEFKGIVLPRSVMEDDHHIVLKLYNGYNVGINVHQITDIKELGYRKAHYKIPEKEFPYSVDKPSVTLLGTGGTIASRLDYRTGAVIPAFSPGELYGAVPELADISNLKTEKLFGLFSENMGPNEWKITSEAIGREIEAGVDGIVIGHGTDTMHHTGGALSFMVQGSPVPIILVGSQRSSDRPSSDAAMNLICAVNAAARADIAEVMVCMLGPTSEDYCLLHQATRVRKMHSSYRSTFRTVGDIPMAKAFQDRTVPIKKEYKRRRPDRNVTIDTAFEERVSILYYYPNMLPDIVYNYVDKKYKGLIIAGTGLGHVNKPLYEPLRYAIETGMHIYMTVQTLWGYVQMNVYDTGRDLLNLGIVPMANCLPEVAYIKLGWVLGHTENREEVERMMLTPVAGEITEREPHNGYIILQGGIPEVDDFIKKHHI